MKRAACIAGLVALPFCANAEGAEAQGGRPTVRLLYQLKDRVLGCPSDQELRRQVADTLGYDPLDDRAPRTIRFLVSRRGGSLVARIETAGTAVREIESLGNCADLMGAAGLSLAVAIDPLFVPLPVAKPSPPAAVAPTPMAPPVVTPVPPRTATPVVRERAKAPPDAPVAGTWRPTLVYGALSTLAHVGELPAAGVGFSLEGGMRWGGAGVAIEVRHDLEVSVPRAAGEVRASAWRASLGPCIAPRSWFGILACAPASVGFVPAAGAGFDNNLEGRALLAAVGARIGWESPALGLLRVRPFLGVDWNLRRVNLLVDGKSEWKMPWVSATGGLSLLFAW